MSAERQHRGRILVVDDEAPVVVLLRQWLEGEGYAVECAADFASLRRLMNEQTFDLITLDVRMPGVDGLEVLDWLAKLYPETGAVMATALGDLDTVIGAMRKGAIGYLLKPFDMELVSQEIDRAIERQRLQAENRAHRLELEWLVAERTRQLRQAQARLERQVRELEGRDRLVRLQMDPPAEMDEVFAAILRVVARATGAAQVALWQPDEKGECLERVAALERTASGDAEIAPVSGDPVRLPIRDTGEAPVRAFRSRWPEIGIGGQVAVPVLYSEEPLAALQAVDLPEEEEWDDVLTRLGREAALVLRMAQVARDLEREEPALGALLRTDAQL